MRTVFIILEQPTISSQNFFGRAGDLQTAEQYYHLCLARNQNHAACQRGLAVLLVETGRTGDAATQLEQWAAREPANPEPK